LFFVICKWLLTISLISLYLLTGCGSKIVPYTPKATISVEQAKQDIKSLLFAQIVRYQPGDSEITDRYMKQTWAQKNIVRKTIMFEHIANSKLYVKKNVYIPILYDKNNHVLEKFYYQNENDAKAFINAVEVMRKAHKTSFEY